LPGTAPRPGTGPAGCFFAPRCAYAVDECGQSFPPVARVSENHEVRCFRHREVLAEAAQQRAPAPPKPEIVPSEALLEIRGVDASHGERQVLSDLKLL